MHSQAGRLIGNYLKLLFPVILAALLIYSCNQSHRQTAPAKQELINNIENKEYEWSVSNNIPGNDLGEIENFFITDDKQVYGVSRFAILALIKNEWKKLLTPSEGYGFVTLVVDGDLILYNENRNMNTSRLIYRRIYKENNSIKFSSSHEIPIPFSEEIHGIKRLSPDKYLILGLMEYAVVEIIDAEKNKYKINHYGIFEHPCSNMRFVIDQFSNEPLLRSVDAIYRFDPNTNYSKIIKVLGFPDPLITKENIEYYRSDFTDECFGKLDYGIFRRRNQFYFYEKMGNSYKIQPAKYLLTTEGDSISPLERHKFIMKDKQNIYCMANGRFLKKINDSAGFPGNKWRVLGKLPEKIYRNFAMIDDDNFITGGKETYTISKKKTPESIKKDKKENANYLFTYYGIEIPSSTYGCCVGDFENRGKEGVYFVGIIDNNKYYPNFYSDYPSNEAAIRGLEGRKIISKTKTNSLELDICAVAGDIDESGADDIIVTNLDGPNSLYINNGEGYFKYSTHEYGLDSLMNRSEGAALADINNDGWLDLFMTSYLAANRLYLNENGVKFKEATNVSRLSSKWGAITGVFGDINNDGLPDLYVCYWMDYNKMYLNKGDGKFEDITELSGTSCGNLKRSNSAIFADFNNDGFLDLFVGNRGTGNNLFINKGNGKFSEITETLDFDKHMLTYGAAAGDFNYDGWLDLFVTDSSGAEVYLNSGIRENGSVILLKEKNAFAKATGNIKGENKGVAVYDFDSDNDLDLVMGQNNGRIFKFLNRHSELLVKNYLLVKLIGSQSNRNAIGAKLRLKRNNALIGYREVNAGSGYAGSNTKIQHFGLGDMTGEFELEVEFPTSKIIKKYKVTQGSVITVHEHEGFNEFKFTAAKTITRFFNSGGLWYEIYKSLILIPLLVMMFFIIKSPKIKYIFPGYVSPDKTQIINTSLVSVSLYFITVVTIQLFFYYFPDSNNWINNTRNIFVENYLPFMNAMAPFALFQLMMKSKKTTSADDSKIVGNVITKLKGFHHGESSAMCLNRLSLFFKNISSIDLNDPEIKERILVAITEYQTVTFKDVEELSEFCEDLSHNKKFYNYRTELKQKSRTISKSANQLNNTMSKIKSALSVSSPALQEEYRVPSLIEKLRGEVDDLNEIIKLSVTSNVNKVVTLICNKFSDEINIKIILAQNIFQESSIVYFPPNELEKLLSILVQNSIDAYNGIEIIPKIIRIGLETNTSELRLLIEDYGCGITEDEARGIFTKGFTTKKGGNGFGLNYVKNTLNNFGGDITFISEPGKGSVFTVRLKKI